MSDEKALLAAIWEHPQEDTPRLVYADWLDEHDRLERAEFIRLQCERARLDEWDDAARIEQLKQREEQLWAVHRKDWKAGLPTSLKNATFRRGFAYARYLGLGGAKFLKMKPDALDAAPQWAANLGSFARLFDKVFRSPLLIRFDELYINMLKCPHNAFEKLADNDRLRNVSDLFVSNQYNSTAAQVAAFFNGPAVASVTKLGAWTLTPEAFAGLSASRVAARLCELNVCFDGLDFGGVAAPFSATAFPRLRALWFRNLKRPIENAAVRLVTATPDTQLRKLDLRHAGLTDAGLEQLAAWPGLARLRSLDLDDNRFGEAGFRALARSPHAGNLKYLQVHEYWLRDLPAVRAELDARFGAAIHSA